MKHTVNAKLLNATVLIVEDEEVMADILADNLRDEGYRVLLAPDGDQGLEIWQRHQPDLVVLDVMLPHLDGFEVCRRMRARHDTTPVLFLSAKGQTEDRIRGLSVGGDDYLAKPFDLQEFLLRVNNMLRRRVWAPQGEHADADRFEFGGHVVDFRRYTVRLADGREVGLGERERNILRLLSERANEVVSRDDILDEVWGDDAFPSSRTVDNFVMRLRKLLEPDPSDPIYVHTVWGVGYKFTPEGRPEAVES
ncbi:MAG: response regulator transcription factor [Trueperaceae bacterium]|nr:response regulator transcription factor [Trueperaceae bacterium]